MFIFVFVFEYFVKRFKNLFLRGFCWSLWNIRSLYEIWGYSFTFLRTSTIGIVFFLNKLGRRSTGAYEAILVLQYFPLIGFQKCVRVILSHSFIDLHITFVRCLLRCSAHLIVSSYFIHHVEVGGVSQIGVIELSENVLARSSKQLLT